MGMNKKNRMIILSSIILLMAFGMLAVYYNAYLPTEKQLGNPMDNLQVMGNVTEYMDHLQKTYLKPNITTP